MTVLNSIMGRGAFDITPDDDNNLPKKAYGVRVTGAGDLHYVGDDNEEDTVTLAAYERWPVVIKKVFEDSTVTGIKGFVGF